MSNLQQRGTEQPDVAIGTPDEPAVGPHSWAWRAMAAVVAASFLWAYWPTLVELVRVWDREPDYSHGFLVIPLALYFLWVRRERFPGLATGLAWSGLALIGASLAIRFLAGRFYLDALDGWSILAWLAGVVWLLGGRKVLRWAMPSIAFLFFMIPLPYRLEHAMRLPLQRVATEISCWSLQSLGQPALAEGTTILLGEHQLGVEEACSGLRIFMVVVALAFAYLMLVRRSWWERVWLLLSIVPIALVANATRVVVTGLLYQYASGEAAQKFSHDVAGWMMIPLAGGLFALVLWYLSKLVREEDVVDIGSLVR